MEDKAITVGGKNKRHIKQTCVIQPLLHPFANLMLIGFCFNNSKR